MTKQNEIAIIRIGLFLCLVLLIIFPGQVAYANAAPPPSIVWFLFGNTPHKLGHFTSIQLLGCTSTDCNNPVLLQQYGLCNSVNCLKTAPFFSGFLNEMGCADEKCHSSVFPNHGGTSFKLLIQFATQTLTSDIITALPSNYGEVAVWNVNVLDDHIIITPSTINPSRLYPEHHISRNLLLIGLSIITELLIASLCFILLLKVGIVDLPKRLLIVLLINLVTLPVVWLFFPSLGYFQTNGSHIFGILVLVAASVYASILLKVYAPKTKNRSLVLTLAIISIPFVGLCLLYILFITQYQYGNHAVIAQGLPTYIIIIMAEAFATIVESSLMIKLSQKSIPVRVAWITGILMNLASYILGLIMIR